MSREPFEAIRPGKGGVTVSARDLLQFNIDLDIVRDSVERGRAAQVAREWGDLANGPAPKADPDGALVEMPIA